MLAVRVVLTGIVGMSLAGAASPSMAQATSADDLASTCRWVRDAPTKEDTIRTPKDFDSGSCWGYFSAIQDLSRIAWSEAENPALKICVPPQARLGQIVRIFMNYVERNPSKGHLPSHQVALDALWEAFPCKAK